MRKTALVTLAALAASLAAASTAEARWVSVGVNGLALNEASTAICTDGLRIEGATLGGASIGFTGRWSATGPVDDQTSPIAIERGFIPPLVPLTFPAVDPPFTVDVNNDGSIGPDEEFPWHGTVAVPWDGGLTLPVGARVSLTAPLTDTQRVAVLSGAVGDCALFAPQPLAVSIDVVPLSATNAVYPHQALRPILVALLSTPTFHADAVPAGRIRFGKVGTEAAPIVSAKLDVNGDGLRDRLLAFVTGRTGIACGDTTATLTGATAAGDPYRGRDAITTRC